MSTAGCLAGKSPEGIRMQTLLRKFSISTRLMSVAILAFLAIASLVSFELKSVLYEQRRAALSDHVQSALGVVIHHHKLAQEGAIDEAETQRRALAAISDMRYHDGKGYF